MRMQPPTLALDTNADLRQRAPALPKAYIAGPIWGIDEEARSLRFRMGAAIARRYGFVPVVPFDIVTPDHDGDCPPGRLSDNESHTEACKLKADFKALLDCDAFVLLPGWPCSWGTKLELQIAGSIGLKIFSADLEWSVHSDSPIVGRLIEL